MWPDGPLKRLPQLAKQSPTPLAPDSMRSVTVTQCPEHQSPTPIQEANRSPTPLAPASQMLTPFLTRQPVSQTLRWHLEASRPARALHRSPRTGRQPEPKNTSPGWPASQSRTPLAPAAQPAPYTAPTGRSAGTIHACPGSPARALHSYIFQVDSRGKRFRALALQPTAREGCRALACRLAAQYRCRAAAGPWLNNGVAVPPASLGKQLKAQAGWPAAK